MYDVWHGAVGVWRVSYAINALFDSYGTALACSDTKYVAKGDVEGYVRFHSVPWLNTILVALIHDEMRHHGMSLCSAPL
jgi:hypothetical protein